MILDDKTLKALGDPSRWKLLELLSRRGYCVSALACAAGLSESAVSQHLRILREAGLAYGVKIGYYTHYRVDRDALGRLIGELEALRDIKPEPCGRPFYGCPQAAEVRCRAYVPPEQRDGEDLTPC